MIKHTFLDKCCTIVKNSNLNTGLNPVAELNYGNNVSRALIHFEIEELQALVEDKTFTNLDSLTHILKLTNCGSVNNDLHNKNLSTGCDIKERATSFTVLLFKVPYEWDNGKGIDFANDFWISDHHKFSTSGCNWFQCKNGQPWDTEGIISQHDLSLEYDKFSAGEKSIIVARQKFDIGNENFEFDITDYVNDLIIGKEKNRGLCIAFTPLTEQLETEKTQYVGFFGPYTNTFFHPYLETIYSDSIKDDRNAFHMGQVNRLYFYCDGFNLDEMPTCSIEGFDKEIIVKQQTKGVYYAEFSFANGEVDENSILIDIWDNIIIEGELQEPQEYEFVVLKPKEKFGYKKRNSESYVPFANGINADERLEIGEIRDIEITFRKKYTTNEYKVFNDAEYRIYCMDGSKELVVFDYHPIDAYPLKNSITFDTMNFIPNKYHMDIKRGNEYYRDVLRFEIVSNINNKFI